MDTLATRKIARVAKKVAKDAENARKCAMTTEEKKTEKSAKLKITRLRKRISCWTDKCQILRAGPDFDDLMKKIQDESNILDEAIKLYDILLQKVPGYPLETTSFDQFDVIPPESAECPVESTEPIKSFENDDEDEILNDEDEALNESLESLYEEEILDNEDSGDSDYED